MIPKPQVALSASHGVGFVTLARPERLNAVTAVMLDETMRAIVKFEQDASVRVIVLTGQGRAFSAGADITATDPDDPSDPGEITPRMLDALAVLPRQVGQSADGYGAADSGVGPVVIVFMEPSRQGVPAG